MNLRNRTPLILTLLLFLAPLTTQGLYMNWYLGDTPLPTPEYANATPRLMLSIHTHEHTDEIFHRHFVRFVMHYTVRRITELQANGAPAELKITGPGRRGGGAYVYVRPVFAPGATTFEGPNAYGRSVTVRMLDAAGQPVAEDPFYFELTEPDGDRFRMYAQGAKNQPFGAVASWHPVDGEPKTLADFGIILQTDAEGAITGVRTPSQLAFLEDVSDHQYQVTRYELPETHPPASHANGLLPPEGAVPFSQALVKNLNPESGDVFKIIDIKRRSGNRQSRWTKNPIGDYDLAIHHENGEFWYQRSARWWNEDRTRFYQLSGFITCGGAIQTTTTTRGRIAGEWMDLERKVEIGERVTVESYAYYETPASHLRKVSVIRHCDGRWEAFDYDEEGRRDIEIRPIAVHRQVVEYVEDPDAAAVADDDPLGGLLDAFTDGAPPGKRRVTRTVTEYHPQNPPEIVRQSLDQGEVKIHTFTHPDPEVVRAPDDDRPAVTTVIRNGEFAERNWITYDVERDGRLVTLTEWTDNPDRPFGHPRNHTRTRW